MLIKEKGDYAVFVNAAYILEFWNMQGKKNLV
jgi:hypothetical protein